MVWCHAWLGEVDTLGTEDVTMAMGTLHNGSGFNTVLPPNSPCWMANATVLPSWYSAMPLVAPSTSWHSAGVNVCLADGSVTFIADEIDPDAWTAFGSRAGGEVVTLGN
jgi:prepilin-type processing-associated H-X9-DG protein